MSQRGLGEANYWSKEVRKYLHAVQCTLVSRKEAKDKQKFIKINMLKKKKKGLWKKKYIF